MILVAIGSTNPVKKNAAKAVFQEAFGKIKVLSFSVPSNVPDQPFGDDQIIKGAVNRAKKAIKKGRADFGVGLEGGSLETKFGLMESAWCCVVDKKGKVGLGGGLHFELPEKVAKRLRNGEELGPIMDDLTGIKDVKKKGGAVEIFTKGLLTRTDAYKDLVKMALVKFLSATWF